MTPTVEVLKQANKGSVIFYGDKFFIYIYYPLSELKSKKSYVKKYPYIGI